MQVNTMFILSRFISKTSFSKFINLPAFAIKIKYIFHAYIKISPQNCTSGISDQSELQIQS